MRTKKTGLVLEGGAMRGLFTAGVLDVMMEHGIEVDAAIGVSAGAVFGCNYKSRQIGRTIRYNLKYSRDPRYGSFRSLVRTGDYYGAQFCYHEIPARLDPFDVETYQKNPMKFFVVCTDAATGRPVYHRCDRGDETDLKWFRASAAMPLVSRKVEIGGRKLLDGGIADSIPLRYFRSIGYRRNIVILTQPWGYVKRPNSLLPLMRISMRHEPRLLHAMERRHVMYNDTLRYLRRRERRGDTLVIRPPHSLAISRTEHDQNRLIAVYRLGRATGKEYLPRIREFLEGK